MVCFDQLFDRYPLLLSCKDDILKTFEILKECFENGHKLLIAGNGGSSADAEHIVGELAKSFKLPRKVKPDFAKRLIEIDPIFGEELSNKLQNGLFAISLSNHQSLNTAFVNDVDNGGLLTFAQQVNVFGQPGDVLLAISTSGNAKNIQYACITAKAKEMKIVGLTGKTGGVLKSLSDASVVVPSNETYIIQEYHLPIYHCLCLMLENYFYSKINL